MISKLFLDHPKSVGETYGQHFSVAMAFSWRLFWTSIACFFHALIPGLFIKTGSRSITKLYQMMQEHRVKPGNIPDNYKETLDFII